MNGPLFVFDSGSATHEGRVRSLNEDRVLVEPAAGLWLVADGMGGHNAGDVASSEIVSQMATIGVPSSASDQHARFVDRLTRANEALQAYSERHHGATVGSTVAALLIHDGQYRCLWLGDSRIYLARRGSIKQLSRDHSEVQELLDKGILTPDEARSFAGRNVITRAVGVQSEIEIDLVYGTVEPGDCYLLCSDGLTAHCTDADILEAVSGRRAQSACDLLVEWTLERGATDNVSVVAVNCRSADLTVPLAAFPQSA
jgi:serine/threonine protein phosphatase PrpC